MKFRVSKEDAKFQKLRPFSCDFLPEGCVLNIEDNKKILEQLYQGSDIFYEAVFAQHLVFRFNLDYFATGSLWGSD